MDNAVAEAFNSTLEFELLFQQRFVTRQQSRRAVAGWIDHYNLERRHSTARIGAQMMSPIAYEQARAHATGTPARTKRTSMRHKQPHARFAGRQA